MGYMGISIFGSDAASSFLADCEQSVAEQMKKEINIDHGEYNTNGVVNVALFIDEVLYPVKQYFCYNKLVYDISVHTKEQLQNMIESANKSKDWTSKEDKDYFLERMKDIKTRVNKFIKFVEEKNPDWKNSEKKKK